jgi:nickel-dependent lactate racemase
MLREIELPYGSGTRTVALPEERLAFIAGPKYVPPAADLRAAVLQAIRSPIGAPALKELVAHHGTRTVILVDDGTRSTPQALILPVLLDELNAAGVPDGDITLIVALGTHRRMSEAEMSARVGADVFGRVKVENLSQKPEDFVDMGVTPLGIPIHVSRKFLESQISIAVGNIIPHMYAGWAGGAKMVQPGVTSAVTTARTHLMAGPRVYEILGDVDNPVRREMEQIAVKAGLKFIVNVVLNAHSEVVAVVAGDVIQAHRAGVEIARPIYTVEIDERPEILVASSHPADRDLWQGFKPVNNCGMLVKDGGSLILLHPAPEGIAPDHPTLVRLGRTPAAEVQRMVDAGELADEVAAATYLAYDQTRRRISVTLVSDGITEEEGAKIGLLATTDFDRALREALERHGPAARIGVITHGADIMGRFLHEAADGGRAALQGESQ